MARIGPVATVIVLSLRFAGIAIAETEAEERPQARLVYQVNGVGCPDEAAFRDMVAARLGYDAFSPEAGRIVMAWIAVEEDGIRGVLEARGQDGTEAGRRELEEAPGQCQELAESLALALAVIIDPLSLTRAPPAPSPAEPSEPPERAEGPTTDPPREEQVQSRAQPEPEPGPDLGVSVQAAFLCSVGLTPDAALGGLAEVALTVGRFSLGLEGRAEARVGRGRSLEAAVFQGAIVPCVGVAFLSFCGVVGLGAYQARATDVAEPELVTSFYGSAGARVMAGLEISEMFSLESSPTSRYPSCVPPFWWMVKRFGLPLRFAAPLVLQEQLIFCEGSVWMDTSPTESPGERGPEEVISSFEAVFEAEFSYVCRTLRRLGIAERDLDDVAQEVFVSVYRRFTDYDPARPIRPWLFSFALRVAANYRRLAKHRREVAAPEREVAAKGLSPEGLAARNEARVLVQEGLEKLDFDRRVVLVMHDIDGFSVPEISKVLSAKVNTVYSRLRLARRDFEKAVRRIQARGGVR